MVDLPGPQPLIQRQLAIRLGPDFVLMQLLIARLQSQRDRYGERIIVWISLWTT